MRHLWIVLLLPLLAGCTTEPSTPASADLILVGPTWTGIEWVDAVAIQGTDILAVGNDALAMAGPQRLIEGVIYPGFRDNHAHVLRVGIEDGPETLEPAFAPRSDVDSTTGRAQSHPEQYLYHGSRNIIYRSGQDVPDTDYTYERCTAPTGESAQYHDAIRDIEDRLASMGLTTMVEAQARNMDHVVALLELQSAGDLRLRWQMRIVPGCIEHLDHSALQDLADARSDAQVKLLGVKLYADGYMGDWAAALREPYSDRPETTGILAYDDETLRGYVRQARDLGLNIGSHAIGDASVMQILAAYRAIGIPHDARWTIEHAQVTPPDVLDAIEDTGVLLSYQLSFATSDQHIAPDRLGDRVDVAYQWRTMQDRGIPLVGGSDFPSEVVHPLWGLQRVTTRQEVDGSPAWKPEQALDMADALHSITAAQAHASFEPLRGQIAPGMRADLTVLDTDILASPDTTASAAVLMTMVDGRIVFDGEQRHAPA